MNKEKNSNTMKIFSLLNGFFMILLCMIFLYPLIYTLSMSLSDAKSILEGKVLLFPKGFTLEAYRALAKDKSIRDAFIFTVELTISGVIASIIMTTVTAYPLSRRDLKGTGLILKFIVFTMYFSGGLIPTYILVKNLGLTNKMGALILPGMIDTFLLIIMISYFRNLPVELEEAAKVEGCSNIGILLKIYLPLSMPVIATLTIFYAVSYWNTFFNALIYIQSPKKYTLQIKLYQVLNIFSDNIANSGDTGANLLIPENLKGATVFVTVLPIIFIYPFLQKYFIKGVTIGALKG